MYVVVVVIPQGGVYVLTYESESWKISKETAEKCCTLNNTYS